MLNDENEKNQLKIEPEKVTQANMLNSRLESYKWDSSVESKS